MLFPRVRRQPWALSLWHGEDSVVIVAEPALLVHLLAPEDASTHEAVD